MPPGKRRQRARRQGGEVKRASGDQVRSVLGHFTWASLLRREALCIPQALYGFMTTFGSTVAPLWSSALRELRWMSALLPLLAHQTNLEWSGRVYCSDSSTEGFAAGYASFSPEFASETPMPLCCELCASGA